MEYTSNLHLKKPESEDEYDIQNENDNMDILDAAFNMGDIVKLEHESDLGEPTLEKKRTLFYCGDSEKYFYVRHINGSYRFNYYGLYVNPTFNVDSYYQYYQKALDTGKYYKGSRSLEDLDSEIEEGVTFPTGTYPEFTYVLCHTDAVQKLYVVDSSVEGGFREITNFEFLTFTNPSLDGLTNDTYYFGYTSSVKKLMYFEHTDWEETEVIELNQDEPPAFTYYNTGKCYKINSSNNLMEMITVTPDILAWEPMQTKYDIEQVKKIIEANINTRVVRQELSPYGYTEPKEDMMGDLWFDKENSRYQLVMRKSIQGQTLASLNAGTFQSGLKADMPDAQFGNCSCYFATDENKYYVRMTSSGGFLVVYWGEVSVKEVTSTPSAYLSNIGYYKITNSTDTTIYRIYGIYEWLDLAEKPKITDTTDYSTKEFKGIYVAPDTGSAPTYIPEGVSYETYEVAE